MISLNERDKKFLKIGIVATCGLVWMWLWAVIVHVTPTPSIYEIAAGLSGAAGIVFCIFIICAIVEE